MTSKPAASEFLVISRGQWDQDLPPERIQEAIDRFYAWKDQLVAEGRMKAGQRLARDLLQWPDCGWSAHVARLDLHTVDADHLGMLEKPKVAEVARLLLVALERAEAAAGAAAAAGGRARGPLAQPEAG